MIDRILIPPSYNFLSGSPIAKNYWVKRAWLGAILGWVTESLLRCEQVRIKMCRKD
jgi:hypothetical protein